MEPFNFEAYRKAKRHAQEHNRFFAWSIPNTVNYETYRYFVEKGLELGTY